MIIRSLQTKIHVTSQRHQHKGSVFKFQHTRQIYMGVLTLRNMGEVFIPTSKLHQGFLQEIEAMTDLYNIELKLKCILNRKLMIIRKEEKNMTLSIEILLFLLMVWQVVVLVQSQTPCPNPSEGCDCSSDGYVFCSGITDIPANLPISTVFLNLDSNPIGPELLRYKMKNINSISLEQLYLSGTGIEVIENKAFTNQSNLRTLDLSMNNFRILNDQMFYGLENLESLLLTKSSILRIRTVLFTYVPSLLYLDMDGNMLSNINDEFSSLINLETLLISSNGLSSISENAFENLQHLERLELYDNELKLIYGNWFKHLVNNNGSLKLSTENRPANSWNCCSITIPKYKEFLNSLVPDLNSREQYNINCASPQQFVDINIEEIPIITLSNTCPNIANLTRQDANASYNIAATRNRSLTILDATTSLSTTPTQNYMAEQRGNNTGGVKFEITCVKSINMFSHLEDVHIILILLTVVVLVAATTAVTVRYYYIRQKSKGFDDFLRNAPKSKHEESDDDFALTTRTYRQTAAVYGSTGQVVDRHKNGMASVCSTEETSSEELESPVSKIKRKPPPYEPSTPSSPEDHVFDGTFSATQFNNNSSSVRRLDERRKRSGAFSNYGYKSDISEDMWDFENTN